MRRPGIPGNPNQRSTTGRPNTLGLRGRDLVSLLDELDIADPICESQRDFVRWPFRYTSLRIQIVHPGGNATDIRVACRNLSRGGMSVLHSTFLHPGSRCTVHLPHPTQREVAVDGWVVRCNHRSGMVHEFGVAFSRHIDVHSFVPRLPLDMFTLERVDAASLAGSILYVDDCSSSFKILRHHLQHSALRLSMQSTGQLPPKGSIDIIMVGHSARDAAQAQFLTALRMQEPGAALVVITSQHPESARKSLAGLTPDAVLVRPVQQDLLLRCIGEYLLVRRRPPEPANETAPSTLDAQLAQDLAHSMLHWARRLEEAVQKHDAAACRALCVQIAGAAPSMGLRGVGRLAAQTADDLTRTMDLHRSLKAVRSVITACHRIQNNAA